MFQKITTLLFLCHFTTSQLPLDPNGGQHRCGQCFDDSEAPRLICGSDGRTYTVCELQQSQCMGYRVEVTEFEKCSGKRCPLQQKTARSQSDVFVPECNSDGTFKTVQCHKETGHCWCVDRDGKMVPGSTVSIDAQIANDSRVHGQIANCSMAICFTPLMKEFKAVFTGSDTTLTLAAEWKFDQLDKNNDSLLDANEYTDFKRLLKRMVTPKPCARNFIKFSDSNNDNHITLTEWKTSLGLEGNVEDEQEEIVEDEIGPAALSDKEEQEENTEAETVEEILLEADDCKTVRQTALERSKFEKTYVPECSPDGLYRDLQCHAGFCWCVALKTGKPILGTTHNKSMVADCSSVKLKAKTLKGCSQKKRIQFAQNLVSIFYSQKNPKLTFDAAKSSIVSQANSSVLRNEIMAWKFSSLDTNHSGRLERDEWRSFRREWKNAAALNVTVKKQQRKCWRNVVKFCDEDEDKTVSRNEWIQCSGQKLLEDISGDRARKKNPFTNLLKS